MTYYIAATLPEGPVKEEVIRTMRKFKVIFEGSTNPTRVKNFIDRQAFALASVKYPENPPGKPTKPIRPVHRVVDEGCPSTSGTSSTSREVVQTTAPVEQFNEVGQSPMMAAGSSKNVINDEMKCDDDDDDPLQHILNVCNKRAGQIEMEKNLDEVFREHDRNERAEKGGVPPEVKQEEPDLSDVVEGEDVKPPIFTNEATNHSGVEDVQQPPPFVKEEEPEVEDDVMDVFPEEVLDEPLPSSSFRHFPSSSNNPKMHFCPVCDAPYCSKHGLTKHINEMHPLLIIKNYACKMCPKRFSTRYQLGVHAAKHVQDMNHCLFPNQRTPLPKVLLGVEPFKCELCGEEFLTNTERAVHKKRLHPGPVAKRVHQMTWRRLEPPTTAPSTSSSNSTEYRYLPLPKKPRPPENRKEKSALNQECWVCPLHFPAAKELMTHMFTHEGPFECHLCAKTFALERILMLHKEFQHKQGIQNMARGLFY